MVPQPSVVLEQSMMPEPSVLPEREVTPEVTGGDKKRDDV